jgi:hypothetical protein
MVRVDALGQIPQTLLVFMNISGFDPVGLRCLAESRRLVWRRA